MEAITKNSLLFIPDISGFTSFVKETEISHSRHIISELLELIIDSNELDLVVAEIEGDAVLFYKYQQLPDAGQLLNQARKMFFAFHRHLKRYENERICQCGACSGAARLSLKFIIHAADFQFIEVHNTKKPYGQDVILAHRLLKNNISENEYILFSDSYTQQNEIPQTEGDFEQEKLQQTETEYDQVGMVRYSFLALAPLLNKIPPPEKKLLPVHGKQPISIEGVIDKPIDAVYEMVTNLDLRKQWNKGVDKLEYEENRVNRVGTDHVCLIGQRRLGFKTVTDNLGEGRQVYGEQTLDFPFIKQLTTYFILEQQSQATRLRIEVRYKPQAFSGWFFLPIFKMMMKKNLTESFDNIKLACEANQAE